MTESKYTVVKKASIRPGKIVFYNQFLLNNTEKKEDLNTLTVKKSSAIFNEIFCGIQLPTENKHTLELSKKAQCRIREKVTWLYEMAKNKTVTTSSGKVLSSYKMNFITLTLPSTQIHTSSEITSKCLHQFLTECKEKYNLINYVWRLEFQKNGNAHYHIATDTFIDYTSAKLIWNRCIQKIGYVTKYQEKMSKMTFAQYCQNYSNEGKVPFNTLRERYGRGRATRWDSPNTVDVRAVNNARNIAAYISKYITKPSDLSTNKIVVKREPEISNIRLWFCSRSLSALDKITIFMEEVDGLIDECINNISNIKRFVFDYCSLWYFQPNEQSNTCKNSFKKLFTRYAHEKEYIPA